MAPLPVPPNSPSSNRPSSSANLAAASGGLAVPTNALVGFLQRSLSTISLNRAAEKAEDDEDDGNDDNSSALGIEKAITVAISGATSSGKTTLAILLAEIFSSASSSSGAMTLHEDDWFFGKGACELAEYPARKEDAEFCEKSLRSGMNGTGYSISVEEDEYRVAGPDTDHFSAVNFWGLLKAVKFVKEKGELPKVTGSKVVVRVSQEKILATKSKYWELVNEGRKLVDAWTASQAAANASKRFEGLIVKQSPFSTAPHIEPQILILEGFLLYEQLNPKKTTTENSDTEDEATTSRKNFAYGRMGMVTEVEKQKGDDDFADAVLKVLERKTRRGRDYTDPEIEFISEHHLMAMRRGMKKLQPLMDIKLFLTTSMDTAKERRMGRVEYRDAPDGQRYPGQMWKTAGYFEYVAWKNHVLQHKWLIDYKGNPLPSVLDGVGDNRVLVREPVDASVEVSLKWALKCILDELSIMEEFARKAKMGDIDSTDDEN